MIRYKQFSLALGMCLASAVSFNAAARTTGVPFAAAVATVEYLQPNADPAGPCGALPLLGMSFGSGVASHLGAVTIVATDCILPTGTQFAFSNGKLTFTAANGDTLRAEYMGAFVPQSGNVYTINGGTFRFVGGTGRFRNATGGGELRGTETLGNSPIEPAKGHLQAIGTISY
jgi:hypothetical protein